MSSLRRIAPCWAAALRRSRLPRGSGRLRRHLLIVASSLLLACAAPTSPEPQYAIAALLAGVIPTTAVAIVIATARAKSEGSDGRLRDMSLADDEPFPGLGLDDGDARRAERVTCFPPIR